MDEERKNILVGSLTLAIFLGVGALSFGTGQVDSAAGFTVRAAFQWIDGLSVGDEVRIGGMKVGTVSATRLDQNYSAIVTMRLERDFKLTADSSAKVETDGLFGSKYIELDTGGDDETIADGGEFSTTQSPIIVDDLMAQIIGQAESIRAKYRKSSASGKK